MIIDAHLHTWRLGSGVYGWPDESVAPIHRDFGVADALPELERAGVRGVVLVQAADDALDTAGMLAEADAHPEVVGVVGWVPLDDAPAAEAALDRLGGDDRLVGVRSLIHTYSDPDWIVSDAVRDGLCLLEGRGLAYDFVTAGPAALAHVPVLGERHPRLRIVIDHLGKPPIGGGEPDRRRWRALLVDAAANPLVSAKLSGLTASTGGLDSWTRAQLLPFVADALEVFGPKRLMYGGDWPVSILAGGYARAWEAITSIVDELAPDHRDAIFGGNAADLYRLSPRLLQRAGKEQP